MIEQFLLVSIFGALGFLYVQMFKAHGCLKKIEATLNLYIKMNEGKQVKNGRKKTL